MFLASVAGGIFYLSHQPSIDVVPALFPHQDKLLHMIQYLVLFVAMFLNRELFGRKRPFRLMLLAGTLYAATDEIHQSFVPGRDCSAGDILADMAGLALGLGICLWYMRKREADPQGVLDSS